MVKIKTLQAITLATALLALILGILKSKENLIVPAAVMLALMVAAIPASRKGRTIKPWICAIIILTLAVNMAGAFWTFERYTDAELLDFLIAAPSHIMASYSIVMFIVAYFDLRFDRLLFFVITVFASLMLSSAYTFVLAAFRMPFPDEILYISNYYLNASSMTMLVLCIISVLVVNRYMISKKINLIYPRHIIDRTGEGGG